MTMAHSLNLCCGVASYSAPHWPTTGSGNLNTGDRLGIIVDTRPPDVRGGKKEGADIYFAVNGECRSCAFEGVTIPLCFSISITVGNTSKILIASKSVRPAFPNREEM